MSSELIILITSMLPVSELRLAIPLAMGRYDMGLSAAFFWAVLGNIIPVIFILWFLETVANFLSHRVYFFNRFFGWLFERTRQKHSRKFKHWRNLSLIILVAIPLPFTGAWTGALAAFVFGVPIRKAFPLIVIGILIAGIIVSCLTVGVVNLSML